MYMLEEKTVMWPLLLSCRVEISLVPRSHLQERVWWHSADPLGFINVDHFLEKILSANHIAENTICSANP